MLGLCNVSMDRLCSRLFFNYGFVAYKLRHVFVVVPVVLALVFAPGLLYMKEQTITSVNYMFAPVHGRHNAEKAEFQRRWNYSDDRYTPSLYFHHSQWLDVIVFPKDPTANLFNYVKDLAKVNDWFYNQLQVDFVDPFFNQTRNVSYREICANYEEACFDNTATIRFLEDHRFVARNVEKELRQNDVVKFFTDQGEIADFYEAIFDVRWPTARRQSYRFPMYLLASGTNAITSIEFWDTWNPKFDLSLLQKLRSRIDASPYFNVTAEAEEKFGQLEEIFQGPETSENRKRVEGHMAELEELLSGGMGRFDFVSSVRFFYALKQDDVGEREAGERWLEKAKKQIYEKDFGPLGLDYYYDGRLGASNTKYEETAKLNYIFIYIIMSIFVTLSGVVWFKRSSDGGWAVDWVSSKTLLSLLGVVSSGLASLMAYGLLLYAGTTWHMVALTLPYLVVSIGVDDMFVLLGSWARTKPQEETPVRLAEALSFSAVPITVTSLTDAVSFLVGVFSDVPFVKVFCSYAALAIILNYVFQLTFLTGVFAFAGDLEQANRHNFFFMYKVEADSPKDSCARRHLLSGKLRQRAAKSSEDAERRVQIAKREGNAVLRQKHGEFGEQRAPGLISSFFRAYTPVILSPLCCAATAAVYVAYLAGALYGITIMKEGTDPIQLPQPTPGDPDGYDYFRVNSETFYREGFPVDLLFTHLPDLSVTANRAAINATIRDFIYTEHTLGWEAVWCWMWRYERYWDERAAEDQLVGPAPVALFYRRLRDAWLHVDTDSKWWVHDLSFASQVWTEDCDRSNVTYEELCPYLRLEAFRLTIGRRNIQTSDGMIAANRHSRRVADSHPEFRIVVYSKFQALYEGMGGVKEVIIKNLIIIFVCLVIIALVFIPSLLGVAVVAASLLSINVGVVGYLSLWGCGLDFISCNCLLMSAGLAVNLVAHLTHAFSAAVGDPEHRVSEALANFGAPILQGGLSSVLAVAPVAFHTQYISTVFFRSMLLVVAFGLFHALILLPQTFVAAAKLFERKSKVMVKDAYGKADGNGAARPKEAMDMKPVSNGFTEVSLTNDAPPLKAQSEELSSGNGSPV